MAEKYIKATLINYEKGHTVINIDVLNRLKAYPNFQGKSDADSKPKIIVNNSLDFKTLFNVLNKDKNHIYHNVHYYFYWNILLVHVQGFIDLKFHFILPKSLPQGLTNFKI